MSKQKDSIVITNPELLKEWDYALNSIDPSGVTKGSAKKVHWICSNAGCNHKWITRVADRTNGQGCPACYERNRAKIARAGKLNNKNRLTITHPELLKEWDDLLNSRDPNIGKPHEYSRGSHQVVNWICSKCENKWAASIKSRTSGSGCKVCWEKKRPKQFSLRTVNDNNRLTVTHPELVKEWDIELNSRDPNIGSPEEYSRGSGKVVNWRCAKCGHFWRASILSRTEGNGCPKCAGLLPKQPSDYKELAKQQGILWLGPKVPNTQTITKWKCKKNHIWESNYSNTKAGKGCPICNESRGEKEIAKVLDGFKVQYERGYKINECRDSGVLSFDFAILSKDQLIGLIEFNGIQHHIPIDFFGGKKEFSQLQRRDKIKKEFCLLNNIPFRVISYEEISRIEENIKSFLDELSSTVQGSL